MLNPNNDRLDYGQVLAPPDGYTLDFAIGTTYSLDLDALVGACIALGLSEETDTGIFSENSNRAEEIVAIKLFNQSKNGYIYDFIGEIIDYQTPLKSSRKDVAGKIDLLSYDRDNKVIHILELKKPNSTETMLRCVLEGYTYLRTVDSEKLISDFRKFQDKPVIKANPFVFKCVESNPYQEMQQEDRKWLRKLMLLLDSNPLYIIEIDGQYFVTDK